MKTQTTYKHTHKKKHKYFNMLFAYTQKSLDGGVKPQGGLL